MNEIGFVEMAFDVNLSPVLAFGEFPAKEMTPVVTITGPADVPCFGGLPAKEMAPVVTTTGTADVPCFGGAPGERDRRRLNRLGDEGGRGG